MNYSAYPGYKDSRIEWLGEIPEEWSHSKLGFESIVKARLGWKGLKADEYIASGYIFLATPNIKGNDIDFDNVNYITKERYEESPEIMLQLGDILVTKDGSTVGTTNVVRYLPEAATVNSSIAVVRPFQTLDSIYLYYFLSSSYVQNVIQRMKGGMGVPHLFQEDLRKFSIILPSLSEQTAIANFLDHETAKIDTLIAKQQRLIELLQEKRQALISHAVTKGLNPDAPMKDSGIEWLGEIPAHWNILPVKYFANVGNGSTPDRTNQNYWRDGSHPWLTSGMIHGRYIEVADEYITDLALTECHLPLVKKDSILIAITGEGKTRGTSAIVKFPTTISQHLAYLTISNLQVDPHFLLLYFSSQYSFLRYESGGSGSTRAALTCEYLRNFECPIPPSAEQQLIAHQIESKYQKFEALIQKSQRAIDLLQERRSSLISAAVTGKIDVRGHV